MRKRSLRFTIALSLAPDAIWINQPFGECCGDLVVVNCAAFVSAVAALEKASAAPWIYEDAAGAFMLVSGPLRYARTERDMRGAFWARRRMELTR